MTILRFVLLALTLASTLIGCTSDEGEVCFKDGDCSSGLFCCKTNPTATSRGRCLPEGDRCSEAPRPDAMVDSGSDDGGDAGDAGDAGMACDPAMMGACGDGYCRTATCGAATGVCADRPLRCEGILAPVCSCDGVTYTNECEAQRTGANLAGSGACATLPDSGMMDTGTDASDASSDASDGSSDASDATTD